MTTQPPPATPASSSVSVAHGAGSIIGYAIAGAAVLGGIATGIATVAHDLPAGVPPSIGVWITGIGLVAGALSHGLTTGIRGYVLAAKAKAGLVDAPPMLAVRVPPPPPPPA